MDHIVWPEHQGDINVPVLSSSQRVHEVTHKSRQGRRLKITSNNQWLLSPRCMASVSSESSSQRNRTHLGQLNGTIFYLVEGSKIYFCSQQQLLAHYPIFTPEDRSPSQFSANTWGLCTWALREESSERKGKGLSDSHLGNNDTSGNRLDGFPRSAHENTKIINTTILKMHTKHMWSDGLYDMLAFQGAVR